MSESAAGKGDMYRKVDKNKFDNNFDRIFGKGNKDAISASESLCRHEEESKEERAASQD